MIKKLIDVNTNINISSVENGFIGANFYTEDDGSAYIRITIKNNNEVLDFTKTDMLPRLDLFCSDGSIFTNEPIDIVYPEKGVIQYKVTDNVIQHAGKMDAKLFLGNKDDSVHVANFYFTISDSGMTGPIGKEVHVDSLKDLVEQVMRQNALGLLDDKFLSKLQDDLKTYVHDNNDLFKGVAGEKGEKGDTGDTGPQGLQGIQGLPGKDGKNGIDGLDGKNGVDGIDGVDGSKGDKGDPFTFKDFTQEQLQGLKGEKGERGETGKSIDIKLVDSLINRLNKLENNPDANADKYPDIPRKNLITSYKTGITLTTDTGVEAVESRNASTDFTPVESNTTYIIGLKNILDSTKALYRYGYYDSNKNLISMTSSTSFTDTNKSTTITTPSNAKYIRIVLNVTHKDEIYMNKGTIPYFELPALDPIDVISSDEEFNEYVKEFVDDHVQDSVYKYLASKPTQVVNANNLNKNIGTDVQAEQVFVQEMNKKMKQLGLSSTFANSTGLLNSGNLASAYDFNIIALHASIQPELASIWGQKHLDLYLRGTNPRTVSVDTSVTGASLENTYTILGGKTGTIGTLKNLTVIVANGDDIYVGTVMKASDDRFLDLKNAIDQAIKKDKGQSYDVNAVGTNDTTFSVIKYPKYNPLLTTNYKPKLLLGKNQDTLNNPASMTKIITSIVCIENATNLNQPITFQSSDIVGGSGIAINVGDVMTLREAIYAMMLPSTNTAAKAVARVVGHNIINTRGYV